jgi:hypothetical protein
MFLSVEVYFREMWGRERERREERERGRGGGEGGKEYLVLGCRPSKTLHMKSGRLKENPFRALVLSFFFLFLSLSLPLSLPPLRKDTALSLFKSSVLSSSCAYKIVIRR